MKILIRQARVIAPSSPFHLQQLDIFINHGIIEQIAPKLEIDADQVIIYENLHISSGWIDIFSHFNDPGQEQKESLETGALAAASGGFTQVFLVPNTSPCLHNKAGAEYIIQRSNRFVSDLLPIGAITKNTEGKELAEMYDLHAAGAIAFSDGLNTLQSSGILLKALQYVKAINGIIIQVPEDRTIGATGLMNEGVISTRLGLPGQPAIAEEIMIRRDLELARYAASSIHFTGISTKKSVDLIRQAKSDGISVTCSVTPYHLCFTDNDLTGYDTNLKVTPPLRAAEDQLALKQGIIDGTIDCIAVHHFPQDSDHKIVEFEYAKPGMIGLQTAFATVRSCISELSIEKLISLFSYHPRRIFGLDHQIKEGSPAILTLFNPDQKWSFTPEMNHSKSRNSPFLGKELTGMPLGIINKDNLFLNYKESYV